MGTSGRFWRALRQLFHQTIGAFFLCLSAFAGLVAFHQWHKPEVHWVAWLAIGFAAMMLALGLGAFRDARRIR